MRRQYRNSDIFFTSNLDSIASGVKLWELVAAASLRDDARLITFLRAEMVGAGVAGVCSHPFAAPHTLHEEDVVAVEDVDEDEDDKADADAETGVVGDVDMNSFDCTRRNLSKRDKLV